jgi:hypothetical protein
VQKINEKSDEIGEGRKGGICWVTTSKFAQRLTLATCTEEASGQNPGHDSDYPADIFSDYQ